MPPILANRGLSNPTGLVSTMIPDCLLHSGYLVSQTMTGDNLSPFWRHMTIRSQTKEVSQMLTYCRNQPIVSGPSSHWKIQCRLAAMTLQSINWWPLLPQLPSHNLTLPPVASRVERQSSTLQHSLYKLAEMKTHPVFLSPSHLVHKSQ